MNRILFVEVNNQPEVLMRVVGLLRRRAFHMKSISMVETENPSLAHLMITTKEDDYNIERAMYLIEKIVDVHHVKTMEEALSEHAVTKETDLYRVM
ncbi:acetolactate synthase small subunit [Marinisporobacter balticus]|uniref:Acetolactate synthase small subunit n=1 Tax=Marinisporobacter balticus TaxID=2018667 RepID=A0A4R2KQA8_9FIRM|nr:acetolactate synthase small subunit [Marinisporobacter balticus]TCO73106.1 acetolactate synthase small subunit [Marinisporobacter balticus]